MAARVRRPRSPASACGIQFREPAHFGAVIANY
jgi:hypothetical protein